MWDYDHNIMPISLTKLFTRSDCIHNHVTRGASRGNLYCAKVNTDKYGMKSLKYLGVKVLNNLKNSTVYENAKTKVKFLKDLKNQLLLTYL